MPKSEASTSMMKGRLGSGCLRMGAIVKLDLRERKVWLATLFHGNLKGLPLSSDVSGAAMVL